MTDEDKKIVADYMGWKMSEWMIIDGSAHVVNPHFFDLNDAGLVVQEMQKRGEWTDYRLLAVAMWMNTKSDCEDITAWLFNADNFFNAMSEWLKERGK